DFPTEHPLGPAGAGTDAFVTKISANGGGLLYSTYLGGNADDAGNGIRVDAHGRVYVVGVTSSSDFPLENPLHNYPGDGTTNAFVARRAAAGSGLLFSTYLGGADVDEALAAALDSDGFLYVTGDTSSSDFPLAQPFQGRQLGKDAFVVKLAPGGAS